MIDLLNLFDLSILYFFNRDLANPALDIFFVTIAESKIFLSLCLVAVAVLFWRGSAKLRLAIVLSLVCIALLDPFSHYVLKPLFARPRPCHVLSDLHMLVGCGGKYGFPSNHTVNAFGAATILCIFFRRQIAIWVSIAFVIGISRIYLGRHYPSDVLGGALIGIIMALIIFRLLFITTRHLKRNKFIGKYSSIMEEAWLWKRK